MSTICIFGIASGVCPIFFIFKEDFQGEKAKNIKAFIAAIRQRLEVSLA
jgi:hypothetical protein